MAERCCDKDSDDDPICKCVRGEGQTCGSMTDGLRSWGTGEAGVVLRRVRRWRVHVVDGVAFAVGGILAECLASEIPGHTILVDSNYRFQNHRSDFDRSSDVGVVRTFNTIDVYEISRFELLFCKYLETKKKETSSVTLLEKSSFFP